MRLSAQQKIDTGAFYTPKIWADLAVKYISEIVPKMEDYLFYDMAAGEGALLEALPNNVENYATTLEAEDVAILREKAIFLSVLILFYENQQTIRIHFTNRNLAIFQQYLFHQ